MVTPKHSAGTYMSRCICSGGLDVGTAIAEPYRLGVLVLYAGALETPGSITALKRRAPNLRIILEELVDFNAWQKRR